MTFKKYEGFVVNESETKDQVMADAKLMVETLQAQETDPAVGWYINIVHPKRMYCSVIISDYLRQQFPTIAKNIDLYDEDEFLHDLSIVNNRIDGLHLNVNNVITQQSTMSTDIGNLNTLVSATATTVVNLDKKVKALAASGGSGSSGSGMSSTDAIAFAIAL